MQGKILIATANSDYGELIKQTINYQTHFNAILVKSGEDVLPEVKQGEFLLCVIDAEMVGKFTSALVERIIKYLPATKIVIVPPKNKTDDPMIAKIKVDGYLNKPCYLPDLLKIIENLLPDTIDQVALDNQPTTPSKNLTWLQFDQPFAFFFCSSSFDRSRGCFVGVRRAASPVLGSGIGGCCIRLLEAKHTHACPADIQEYQRSCPFYPPGRK